MYDFVLLLMRNVVYKRQNNIRDGLINLICVACHTFEGCNFKNGRHFLIWFYYFT